VLLNEKLDMLANEKIECVIKFEIKFWN
jgi:hypothetical protein